MSFFRGLFIALLIEAIAALLIFAACAKASDEHHPNTIRWCPEDAVPVGVGDFDGQRWDKYHCIALDDLTYNDDAGR